MKVISGCVLFLYFYFNTLCTTLATSGCQINVNEHLSNPHPLLLIPNEAVVHAEAFALPDEFGTITLNTDDTINVACPGNEIVISGQYTLTDFLPVVCKEGIDVIIDTKIVPFNEIKCKKTPSHIGQYTGKTCASEHKEIEIGFKVKDRFIKHLTTCFNEDLQHAVYSESYLIHNIAGSQNNYPRPSFVEADFYNIKPDSVSDLYVRKNQRNTINAILGLDVSDPSIIHIEGGVFLSTGHYTPKADFVFGAQQYLTFYYVNTAPQWMNFNGGNWNSMEISIRNLAADKKTDFVTYTGSFGIATLPDVNGHEQELYLWLNSTGAKGIPVPAQFYKVVYDPKTESGVALLGFNNPHRKHDDKDKICKDVCGQINWVSWISDNSSLGISYCCEVDDFRQTVKDLPNFTVKSLLNSASFSSPAMLFILIQIVVLNLINKY